jgi:transposase
MPAIPRPDFTISLQICQAACLTLSDCKQSRPPRIWGPENPDLRQLLWHRHRLVQMRTRIMNQLQAVALNEGYRWKKRLFSEQGRAQLEKLMLPPWASRRLKEFLELLTSPQQLPRATFTSYAQALHEHLSTEQ